MRNLMLLLLLVTLSAEADTLVIRKYEDQAWVYRGITVSEEQAWTGNKLQFKAHNVSLQYIEPPYDYPAQDIFYKLTVSGRHFYDCRMYERAYQTGKGLSIKFDCRH